MPFYTAQVTKVTILPSRVGPARGALASARGRWLISLCKSILSGAVGVATGALSDDARRNRRGLLENPNSASQKGSNGVASAAERIAPRGYESKRKSMSPCYNSLLEEMPLAM